MTTSFHSTRSNCGRSLPPFASTARLQILLGIDLSVVRQRVVCCLVYQARATWLHWLPASGAQIPASRSRFHGFLLSCASRILSRVASSGRSTRTLMSNLPSRISASSRPSSRLVAAINTNPLIARYWSIALIRRHGDVVELTSRATWVADGVLPSGPERIDLIDEEDNRTSGSCLRKHGADVFCRLLQSSG